MTQIQIIGLLMYRTNMRIEHWANSKGFTKSTVYRVVSGEMARGSSTEKVRKAISADVGKDLIELWPEAAQTQ